MNSSQSIQSLLKLSMNHLWCLLSENFEIVPVKWYQNVQYRSFFKIAGLLTFWSHDQLNFYSLVFDRKLHNLKKKTGRNRQAGA